MNKAVMGAHAESLSQWADLWERVGAQGSSEMAFLLRRAAKLARAILDDQVESIEPMPKPTEDPQDLPRTDDAEEAA